MDAHSVRNEVKNRWKSQFRVSSTHPNDIQYKLTGFLADTRLFHTIYSIPHNDSDHLNFQYKHLSKSSESSLASGYCSRTSSSVSNSSTTSEWKAHSLNRLQCKTEVTEQQMKSIHVFFSSLSTSVIVCMTPSRIYEIDNLYELGLREGSCNQLKWKKLGEGILFVQLEKIRSIVNAYLCLVNPENCHLYCKIPLVSDSKLNSVRPCLRFLMTSNEGELTKIFGIYFAVEQKAAEFSNDMCNALECLNENNEAYQRRSSFSIKDSQLVMWLQNRKLTNRSCHSFMFKPKPSPRIKFNISNPSNFEQTLHVPLDDYFHEE